MSILKRFLYSILMRPLEDEIVAAVAAAAPGLHRKQHIHSSSPAAEVEAVTRVATSSEPSSRPPSTMAAAEGRGRHSDNGLSQRARDSQSPAATSADTDPGSMRAVHRHRCCDSRLLDSGEDNGFASSLAPSGNSEGCRCCGSDEAEGMLLLDSSKLLTSEGLDPSERRRYSSASTASRGSHKSRIGVR